MKQVLSVCGPLDSNKLGITLTHEHISANCADFYISPPENVKSYVENNIQMNNLGYIRQYPYSNKLNLSFEDIATHKAVENDLKNFKNFGGSTIVENTTCGLGRNLQFFYDVSKKTNVNIIAGTGHYIEAFQDSETKNLKIEEMIEIYKNDILIGTELKNSIISRCGYIGEVGSSWPITEYEKRAIQATAYVQDELGCGVSFHPGRNHKAPFEIVRIYLEAGGNPNKCIMSHLDRTIHDDGELAEFAKLGVYCQFDLFGVECSYYQLNPLTDMPSDGIRIDRLHKLIEEKFDKITISHDIHTKHRLIDFGGHGYSHIITNIIPRMKLKGISDEIIEKIVIENPRNWLEFEF